MATSPQAQHYVECTCGKPSEYFCNTCDVQLCESCAAKHLGVKSEKGHEITKYAKRKQKSTICFCESHTDIECRLFCKTCDLAVCYICVSTKHKHHHAVELHEQTDYIEHLIEDENQTLQYHIRPVYQRVLTRLSSKVSTVPSHFSEIREKLTNTKSMWHQMVDEVMGEFEEDVDRMEKDQTTSLKKQKDMFEERLLKIDEAIQENSDIKNSKNPNVLLKFKSTIKRHCNVPKVTDFNHPSFIPERVEHNALKTKMGLLETLRYFDHSEFEIKVDNLRDCVGKLLNTPSVTPVIDDTGFPPNIKNERLSSVSHLSHNRIWVGGASKELKFMDLQGRLLDTVNITCNGNFIAINPEGNLVYSDYNNREIKMIHAINDDTIHTLFSTGKWRPTGITCMPSRDILLCLYEEDQSLSKVVRYSNSGHVKLEIQYDTKNEPLYDRPWYITLNKNNDICTVNYNNRTLVVVNESGDFRFKYDGKQKYKNADLNTLTADVYGNILISDYKNNLIHMLDSDGHFIRIIAPKGLERPRGICIVERGEICVGEVGTGKIKLVKYLKE